MTKPNDAAKSQEELQQDFVRESMQRMQQSCDFYKEKPKEVELDLVALIRADLFNYCVDEDRLQRVFDTNPLVIEAQGRHTHAQQFQLSRWLNQQFNIAQVFDGIPTQLERYQVIFEARPDEWVKIWREGLIVRFRELDLPRTPTNER